MKKMVLPRYQLPRTQVSGAYRALKTEKDRTIVVGELLKAGVFESNQGVRKHRSHPNPRNLLHQGNKNVREWIANRKVPNY